MIILLKSRCPSRDEKNWLYRKKARLVVEFRASSLLNERQACGIARSHRSRKTKSSPRFRSVRLLLFLERVIMWNNTREREEKREKEKATRRGIGILKNSKGSVFPLPLSSSFHEQSPCLPLFLPPRIPPSRQRLMRGMQFPQALARLSSGAPFPYVPTISPAPTCAFVLIRSEWIREEILRGRKILSSRKCAGNSIIFERSGAAKMESRQFVVAIRID